MAISVRLCSGRTGFEVITGIRIDMKRASTILTTKVATKHVILLNYNGIEISLYPSGRMIIKTDSGERSLEIANRLLKDLGFPINKENNHQ